VKVSCTSHHHIIVYRVHGTLWRLVARSEYSCNRIKCPSVQDDVLKIFITTSNDDVLKFHILKFHDVVLKFHDDVLKFHDDVLKFKDVAPKFHDIVLKFHRRRRSEISLSDYVAKL